MEDPTGVLATLIHISDLHFSHRLTNDGTALRRFLATLPFVGGLNPHSYQVTRSLCVEVRRLLKNRAEKEVPVCVVFTGDLTRRGEPDEFSVGMTFLRGEHETGVGHTVGLNLGQNRTTIRVNKPGLFMVPGNHDIWKRKNPNEYAAFRGHFPERYPTECKILTQGPRPIHLYGIDSTENTEIRHKLARGCVGPEQLERVHELLSSRRGKAVQVVCLHHPLRDPDGGNSDFTMRLDCREAIAESLAAAGADLVLAGHVHTDSVDGAEDGKMPHHVIAGTAIQQFSKCSFMVIDVYRDRLLVTVDRYRLNRMQFAPDEAKSQLDLQRSGCL